MNIKLLLLTFFVFFGCCINVLILESLVTDLNGVANLITFSQFVFIAFEGFIFTSKCGTRSSRIPIKDCASLVVLFFITSVLNNYAYNLNVPNVLHIIIKSGSIVANMIMAMLLKKKQYTLIKYVSALFITIGIILCTLASAKHTHIDTTAANYSFVSWCCGVILLILALFIGAGMGLLQEALYIRCGKYSDDVLYYTHLLPLPLFYFLRNDLYTAFEVCSQSTPMHVPLIGSVPSAWPLLTGNVLTQYLCIRSVYTLTSECTSLTVTLVLTLRKFFSLMLSVVVFNSAFMLSHWIGSILVFLGTLLYFEVFKLNEPKKTQ